MTLRFGTDGVRGVANEDLVPELVVALGRAAARVFAGDRLLIGRDTRRSGPMVQAALCAGLMSEGLDVGDLGVIPTAGVAWMSAAENVPAAMISASHNLFGDNGIKFFVAGGRKLSDTVEARLEEELDAIVHSGSAPLTNPTTAGAGARPIGASVGTYRVEEALGPYASALVATLAEGALSGLSVVLDCANGAASAVAADVFRRAGADVAAIHDAPDGLNINAGCGSTHPADLAAEVVRRGAHVGLAFDGDADRVLAVDAAGRLVDGDELIAICALDRKARGLLPDDTVVVTVMTNLGFRLAMQGAGVQIVETDVGDRAVLEAMEKGGWSLGGEQSGHVIFRDLATTGDGILTGLQVLDVMARRAQPLAELAAAMTRLPQVLRNVTLTRAVLNGAAEAIAEVAASASSSLGPEGRVLVRPSGTEPVVRVMVEAPTADEAEAICDSLCRRIEAAVGR